MKEQDYPGKFIVVEGADGAGTTTQSEKLAEELDAYLTAEPTDGPVGEKIEEMIRSDDYSAESIALAFAADRMLHLEQEVIPRLEKGETVVSDRYYHSSLAYQTALGAEFDWVKEINRDAVKPDFTVVIDLEAEEAMERVEGRDPDTEVIFENLDFEQEVIQRYRELEERLNEDIVYVDGSGSIEEVFGYMVEELEESYGGMDL